MAWIIFEGYKAGCDELWSSHCKVSNYLGGGKKESKKKKKSQLSNFAFSLCQFLLPSLSSST
jgi:hypothetical protein